MLKLAVSHHTHQLVLMHIVALILEADMPAAIFFMLTPCPLETHEGNYTLLLIFVAVYEIIIIFGEMQKKKLIAIHLIIMVIVFCYIF